MDVAHSPRFTSIPLPYFRGTWHMLCQIVERARCIDHAMYAFLGMPRIPQKIWAASVLLHCVCLFLVLNLLRKEKAQPINILLQKPQKINRMAHLNQECAWTGGRPVVYKTSTSLYPKSSSGLVLQRKFDPRDFFSAPGLKNLLTCSSTPTLTARSLNKLPFCRKCSTRRKGLQD